MKKKICEHCGVNEFETDTTRKYCDDCRLLLKRENNKRYKNKDGSGIYKILNKINNKVYIGQSRNLTQRLIDHKNILNNNTHHNRHLQRSWNKYGEDNFDITIIENCGVQELYERENYWINYYKSYDSNYGYNVTIPPKDGLYFGHTEETKRKMSENNRVFDDDELISYLQEYYYHFGKVPKIKDLEKNKGYPSINLYYQRFGSFKEALIRADIYEFVEKKSLFERKEYTKQDIIEKIQKFIENNNRFPNHSDFKNCTENDLIGFNTVRKYFSDLEDLRDFFEFNKEFSLKQESDLALKQLKDLYIKEGIITSKIIENSDIVTFPIKFYTKRFGSLMNAYEIIGIYTKEHVTKEILKFYNVHNKLPSRNDIIEYKLPPREFIMLYYKAKDLKEMFGIDKDTENKLALDSLIELYNKQGFLNKKSIENSKLTKSVNFYYNRFGSLKKACIEAGIPLDKLINNNSPIKS